MIFTSSRFPLLKLKILDIFVVLEVIDASDFFAPDCDVVESEISYHSLFHSPQNIGATVNALSRDMNVLKQNT